jgi:hypothetical protein
VRARSIAGFCLASAAIVGGCGLDPDYGNTEFQCPAESPDCPPGFTCQAGVCRPTTGPDASVDGSDDDAPIDGPLDVCALAMQAADNDQCSAAIDLTAQAVQPAGATVYGDTTGYASELNPAIIATCTGAPNPGPDAIYRVDAPAGAQVMLELAPEDWDGAVYLLDGCAAAASCLGGDDGMGVGAVDSATIAVTSAGTYYVVVDSQAAARAGCFTLRVRI